MLLHIILTFNKFIEFVLSVNLDSNLTPYGCTNNGYCYPANRVTSATGDIICSDCVCPSGTTKTSPTTCDGASAVCNPTSCPSTGHWICSATVTTTTCSCDTGWAKPNCILETTDPCARTPCLDRGTCVAHADGTYECNCMANTYGEQCQYDGDPCNGKCLNGGVCSMIDRKRLAVCECPVGYVGYNCESTDTPDKNYVSCYQQTIDLSKNPNYYLFSSGQASSGTECRDLLINYLKTNINPKYRYSTFEGVTKNCWFSTEQTLTVAPPLGLLGALLETLLVTCAYSLTLTANQYSVHHISTKCEETANPCAGGYCVNQKYSSFTCLCQDASCHTKPVDPCLSLSCGLGTCSKTDDGSVAYCVCPDGSVSMTACVSDPCAAQPCLYGGTCVSSGASYTCSCRNLYLGDNCQIFNACYENKCLNGGTCSNVLNVLDSTFTCTCPPGYDGTTCEKEVFACDTNVCSSGSICTNGPQFTFTCTCQAGYTGTTCSDDIDECADPTVCKTSDSSAICINTVGGYTCECGSVWMGAQCDINKIIYDILNSTVGVVSPDDIDKLTDELFSDPTVVRDIIPFLIGSLSLEERLDMSWDYDDIFLWVAYEEKLIDIRSDFIRWNDKVLGNCFTFNHLNSSTMYKARGSGVPGGLELQTNVQQKEYLPWIETAAITVFTHSWTESVFAESPRIDCRPNNLVQMNIHPVYFERLGGRYGRCVKDVSEVYSYYYGGTYTTDGCLRSCYQDVLKAQCGCMDPRYPAPESEKSCSLQQRNCIDKTTIEMGDPSKWRQCDCPLPCSNTLYNVAFTESIYTDKKVKCEQSSGNKTACYEDEKDKVLLRTSLPTLTVYGFIEQEAFGLTSFLSRLGGLLGILMGISAICVIEFGFLFLQIILIISSNTKLSNSKRANRGFKRDQGLMVSPHVTAQRSVSSDF